MFEIPEVLRQKYLQRRSQDVADCTQKLNESDWAYFTQLGHQLKGNAPSYGFDDLAEIAERIEALAKDKNSEGLSQAVQEFQAWIQNHPAGNA